jgi:hypothetical protein
MCRHHHRDRFYLIGYFLVGKSVMGWINIEMCLKEEFSKRGESEMRCGDEGCRV